MNIDFEIQKYIETNNEWQIVEYSMEHWEKVVDDMRDLKMDLSKV